MKKFKHLLKQVFPFKYVSTYRVHNGEKQLAIWTQWFGKPFAIKRFTLAD